MEKNKIKLYDGKAFGFNVSSYGLENGYLDYKTLANMVGGMVLNNRIYEYVGYENWALESGYEEDDEATSLRYTNIILLPIKEQEFYRIILMRSFIIMMNLTCIFGE